MKRLLSLMALMMVFALSQVSEAKGIDGKWTAEKMQRGKETRQVPKGLSITLEFAPRGKFKATMAKSQEDGTTKSDTQKGTWKVKGDVLSTTVREKVEEMKFMVQGKTLILVKVGKDEKLFLKRVK
jgi:hypothetical protein